MVKFVFYHSKLRKQPYLLKFSNSFSPSDTHACVEEKIRATPLKNWGNFKRVNTILNSKILLNLMDKMKYLSDQFHLRFRLCMGNNKQLYLFLHWQHYWYPYRQLAGCCRCFALSLHAGI